MRRLQENPQPAAEKQNDFAPNCALREKKYGKSTKISQLVIESRGFSVYNNMA